MRLSTLLSACVVVGAVSSLSGQTVSVTVYNQNRAVVRESAA
jgi:hypothetical protein